MSTTNIVKKELSSPNTNGPAIHIPEPHTSIVGYFEPNQNTQPRGRDRSNSFGKHSYQSSIDVTNPKTTGANIERIQAILNSRQSLTERIEDISMCNRSKEGLAKELKYSIENSNSWNPESVAKSVISKIPSQDRESANIIGQAFALVSKSFINIENPQEPIKNRKSDGLLLTKTDQVMLFLLVNSVKEKKEEECAWVVSAYANLCSTTDCKNFCDKITKNLKKEAIYKLALHALQWELANISEATDKTSEEESLLRGESLSELLGSRAVAMPELAPTAKNIKKAIDDSFNIHSSNQFFINEESALTYLQSLNGFAQRPKSEQDEMIKMNLTARAKRTALLVEKVLSTVYMAKLSDDFSSFLKKRRQFIHELFPNKADTMISNLVFLRVINPALIEMYKEEPDAVKKAVINSVCSLVQGFCNGCKPNGDLQVYKTLAWDIINKSMATTRDEFFKQFKN